MEVRRPRTRSDVARKYGHPWPWKVEELLRDAYDRKDGDLRALAGDF